MNKLFHSIIMLLLLTLSFILAQPTGYYDNAKMKSGNNLKIALHNIIKGHTVISYDGLYNAYKQTDTKPNNVVWDMYSDIPGGTPPYIYYHNKKTCGNYSKEGDCYNREHTFPQSLFNSKSPMVSDLFHVYPTDGKVNGMRSNYPHAEVKNPTWTSLNGSKLGSCANEGYTGTVFEPIDSFKGDFARTYFYMAVRYYSEDASWTSNGMNQGADLKDWAKNVMIKWHYLDPVSKKEIDRNNAVYQYQKNRNPFIDHPEWAQEIFLPNDPPKLIYAKLEDNNKIEVKFSRYVELTSSQTITNYTFTPNLEIISAILNQDDPSKVTLNINNYSSNTNYTLTVNNVKNMSANIPIAANSQITLNQITAIESPFNYNTPSYTLYQNYPNPFNPTTTITFDLKKSSNVKLKVFNSLGQEIITLVDAPLTPSFYQLEFDASNLNSGIYYYQLITNDNIQTKKMLLLK
ncbi:MAG TPA: endonuclease [Ignavibacteriales bacterium]|nr:endonuclease [Ignavibacteriales bacterium]HOL82131.1 endonuclease [Ignavibacteriales bacterium]HOM65776.1 endonuclease [Ignavibacteriales bacterium]HPD66942.1 endonuclease [Ignavibacteriales bacterium]HPP34259.1 endonuclease [Ignavibacteriales bacterium]